MLKFVWLTRLQVENIAALAPHRLLKVQKPPYMGRAQCSIDPLHNTSSALENSDDNLKRTAWPSMLYRPQALLRDPHTEGSLTDFLKFHSGVRLVRMACTQLIGPIRPQLRNAAWS